MPTYDYKCEVCGGTLEIQREFSEQTNIMCCQQAMQRVWTAPAVKFNGTGFYSTGG
jgi:putative FmdB family regulatory protein